MYSALLLENVSIEEVKSDFGLQITLSHVLERQPEQLGDSSPRFIVGGRRKFGGALAEGWQGVGEKPPPFDSAQGRLSRKKRENWGTRAGPSYFLLLFVVGGLSGITYGFRCAHPAASKTSNHRKPPPFFANARSDSPISFSSAVIP
jgi:hypothetical protein